MSRIKVLEVLECGGPGGTGNQVAAICNGLDPARFDVGLVYSCRFGDPEDYRRQASGARFAAWVPEMTREIFPARDISAFFKLVKIFRAERPDVVHAHSSKAGVLARLAADAAGVPKIFYSPHGYAFLQRDRSAASRALYRAIELAVSRIGRVIAVSPAEAELARKIAGEGRVELACDAYLGEDPAALSPARHDGIVVGACGRLTAARNPDAFVKLSQRLTDSRNDLRCVWIGDGELRPRLERDLENMNLGPKFELSGWLPASEARRRLLGLDVFVHYSAWDAIPNSVLEAMAAGLPVVASDIPANRGLVAPGETGLLAKNEVELLESCLSLVDDPALRRKMGEAGRRRVAEDFSRRKMIEGLSKLYSR